MNKVKIEEIEVEVTVPEWYTDRPSDMNPELPKYPDAKAHQVVSFVKSAVRLTGYGALMYSTGLGVFILIISELIGILEELV